MKNESPRDQPRIKVVKATPAPRFSTACPWHAENRASYVVPARELRNFRLGDDRVDVRSWPVFGADERLVGTVDRLMVEPSTQRVRYVAISIFDDADHSSRPAILGSVLVPVGLVRRNNDRNVVVIDGLTSKQLESAPRLLNRAVMRADEDAVLAAFGLPNSSELPAADFYKSPRFDERRIRAAE